MAKIILMAKRSKRKLSHGQDNSLGHEITHNILNLLNKLTRRPACACQRFVCPGLKLARRWHRRRWFAARDGTDCVAQSFGLRGARRGFGPQTCSLEARAATESIRRPRICGPHVAGARLELLPPGNRISIASQAHPDSHHSACGTRVEANDKLRVYEATYKPGTTAASAKRPMRAVRALKGGTLERTYEGGTKETAVWKDGETKIITEERAYAIKNVGKTTIHFLVVQLK